MCQGKPHSWRPSRPRTCRLRLRSSQHAQASGLLKDALQAHMDIVDPARDGAAAVWNATIASLDETGAGSPELWGRERWMLRPGWCRLDDGVRADLGQQGGRSARAAARADLSGHPSRRICDRHTQTAPRGSLKVCVSRPWTSRSVCLFASFGQGPATWLTPSAPRNRRAQPSGSPLVGQTVRDTRQA